MSRPVDVVEPDTVERAASRWFARQRSGEMTAAERAELEAWLEADAAHRLAFDVVARAWASAGLMKTAPEVLQLRARHRRRLPHLRRMIASRAMAACLAGAVLGAGGYGAVRTGLIDLHRLPNQTFRTSVGQQTTVVLPDGSVVTLNTDSVLRTRSAKGQRLLYLDKGQAFFKVAHDPSRPFIVHAAGRKVTALGTAFDVRVDAGRFAVVLVEGKVKVEAPVADPAAPKVQATELVAGSELVAASPQSWKVDRTDAAAETAWVTGWLKFDAEPLGEIVGELSRYSERRIVLADPALAQVPVSGRFKPEDIDAFVRALETYGIARVSVNSPTEVRLVNMNVKNRPSEYGG